MRQELNENISNGTPVPDKHLNLDIASLVTEFNERGFLILRSAFEPHLISSLQDKILAESATELKWRIKYAGGKVSIREASNVYTSIPDAKALVLSSKALPIVRAIIDEPLYLYRDAFVEKLPNRDAVFPLHQDSEFWDVQPARLVSLWIPTQDSDKTNGVLEVIPKSHRNHQPHVIKVGSNLTLPDFLNLFLKKFAKKVTGEKNSERKNTIARSLIVNVGNFINGTLFPFLSRNFKSFEKFAELFVIKNDKEFWKTTEAYDLKIGDCVIYHSETIHGSKGNLTEKARGAYIPSFMGESFTRNGIKVSEPSLGYVKVFK
jgi:ectoine hydroxylase-related dioxygenase (phytanoyl-CoA dioxygenase family)